MGVDEITGMTSFICSGSLYAISKTHEIDSQHGGNTLKIYYRRGNVR